MGLDKNGIRLLGACRKKGIDFERSAMIGRQVAYVSDAELSALGKSFEGLFNKEQKELFEKLEPKSHTEDLFKALGANSVHSFDFSDYEQATHLHDFNQPIDEKFHQKYSVVLDGGSLEHIFFFPAALKNCMEMVDKDGFYVGITPTNNFSGHGFYQFSPELIFRAFSEQNGFEVKALILVELGSDTWYQVTDPEELRRRVNLINNKPVFILTIAKRTEIVPIFAETPQQSDYSSGEWTGATSPSARAKHAQKNTGSRIRSFIKEKFSQGNKERIHHLRRALKGSFSDPAFKKVQEPEWDE